MDDFMSENEKKLEDIETQIKAMKNLGSMQFALKATMAEVVVEKAVHLMRGLVDDIESLKQQGVGNGNR